MKWSTYCLACFESVLDAKGLGWKLSLFIEELSRYAAYAPSFLTTALNGMPLGSCGGHDDPEF
jgi:hypothetical protein